MLNNLPIAGNEKYDRKHVTRAGPPFDIWLKNKVEGGFDTVTMDITPSMAADILAYNDRNRPLSDRHASTLAREMSEGRWKFTGQPIIFSNDGRLIDGQHRCAACNKSGVTIRSVLVFGVSDEAFAHIDVGKKRTAGDIFGINGVTDATLMAAATSLLVNLARNRMSTLDTQLSSAQLYDVFLIHPDLPRSTWAGRALYKARLMQPSLGTVLHYVFAQKNREQADTFIRQVADGVGLKKEDAAKRLRDQLILNLSRDAKMSRRRMAGITIKAWNFHRAGATVRQLKFGDDESIPAVR